MEGWGNQDQVNLCLLSILPRMNKSSIPILTLNKQVGDAEFGPCLEIPNTQAPESRS